MKAMIRFSLQCFVYSLPAMEPDCWNFRFIEDAVFEGGWMMKRPAAPRIIIRVVATAVLVEYPIPFHPIFATTAATSLS